MQGYVQFLGAIPVRTLILGTKKFAVSVESSFRKLLRLVEPIKYTLGKSV